MADPHHVEVLDPHDQRTVSLYRLGHALCALGLLANAAAWAFQPAAVAGGEIVLALGVSLACANMHLYDKRIRWFIGSAAWLGLVIMVAGARAELPVLRLAGLGFVFVGLSGLALKERLCFRIPGLVFVPMLLALSLIPMVLDNGPGAAVLQGITGVILCVLTVAKLMQPLHFDIGDKSRYQV
jgi:uncharacterized integral membrane protein